MASESIHAVPTNVITGFLGVGKTTAILHLLKSKPEDERWAILVNEFGEIGVDGSLFQGHYAKEKGIFISEVPGGCMCCTAGLPMQIALNQLLVRAKPHRLLIEPTGLGHPVEVMEVLTANQYTNILQIQNIVTLVDARKLSDSRYLENLTFTQQIEVADLIIGNKQDLYSENDKANLIEYVETQKTQTTNVRFVEQGRIKLNWLHGPSGFSKFRQKQLGHNKLKHDHDSETKSQLVEPDIPECGYLQARNSGEVFSSLGWRFSPEIEFNRKRLQHWMNGLTVERLKAVFITSEGIFGFNASDGALTEIELDDCFESRIEMIHANDVSINENEIFDCIEKNLNTDLL